MSTPSIVEASYVTCMITNIAAAFMIIFAFTQMLPIRDRWILVRQKWKLNDKN